MNEIPAYFGFCVTALQINKEIWKKYRKEAITLKKTLFQKIEKTLHIINAMPKLKKSLGLMAWL